MLDRQRRESRRLGFIFYLPFDGIRLPADNATPPGFASLVYRTASERLGSATPIGHHLTPIDSLITMRLATRCTRAAFGTLTCSSL
ncbi:MAG: hypothetical protein NTW91_02045, partial [Verrucomicrobia bacterium]|nr:hypothetical protein [Verrucomicrobiota bacterium]